MISVNEQLQDAEIGHSVDLARYSTWLTRRIIGILNRTDADLMSQITLALERMEGQAFSVDRLEGLLSSVRALNLQAYQAIERELTTELAQLAAYEVGYQLELFQTTIPPQVVASVGVAAVNIEQVNAAVRSRPFQGALLSNVLRDAGEVRARKVRDAIRIGYTQGETIDQMVRWVRGTRAKGYSDGLLEVSRRDAQAIVRTAVSHTAATARDAFFEANLDLIKALSWSATLDARTTSPCFLRDQKTYTPVTHKPIGHSLPWGAGPGRFHWNCRSVSVPVTKSWKELGLDLGEMPESTRSAMDGQVPASTDFGQWLKKQSAARQDDVLGPTRGKLLREGGLDLKSFATDKGRWLTLDELAKKDSAAFAKAGVTT